MSGLLHTNWQEIGEEFERTEGEQGEPMSLEPVIWLEGHTGAGVWLLPWLSAGWWPPFSHSLFAADLALSPPVSFLCIIASAYSELWFTLNSLWSSLHLSTLSTSWYFNLSMYQQLTYFLGISQFCFLR